MDNFVADWLKSCRRTQKDDKDLVEWIRRNVGLESMLATIYQKTNPQGCKPENRLARTVAFLYAQVEGIRTFSALAKRVRKDDDFAEMCGFDLNKRRPHRTTFSRHFARLTEAGFGMRLQQAIVEKAIELGLVTGELVAIDSAEIEGHEAFAQIPKPTDGMTQSQKRAWQEQEAEQRLQDGYNLCFQDQVRKLPIHADWGCKRNSRGRTHQWFGYKIHVAIDAGGYEIPLMGLLTSASCHDIRGAYPLVTGIREKFPQLQPEYFLYDQAYDAKDLYAFHDHYGQRMIAELNWRNGQPPVGFDENMHPVCFGGLSHQYHSYDPKYDTLRFRPPYHCPGHYCCRFDDCPARERKIKVKDLRLHASPPRGSAKFRRLYARRTAVERTMGGIKDIHQANHCTLKGHAKVSLWVDLALATWTARKVVLALRSHRRGRPPAKRPRRPLPEQLRLDWPAALTIVG